MRSRLWLAVSVGLLISTGSPAQQTVPAEYASVLTSLGRQGDFKDGVLKAERPGRDGKLSILAYINTAAADSAIAMAN